MIRDRHPLRPHLVSSDGSPGRRASRNDVPMGAEFTSHDGRLLFRETILPHLDAAYSLARFLSRDPIAAEDIVQDAFVRALRGFSAYRGEAAKPWLLAIVRNCFFDWAKSRRPDRDLTEASAPEAADPNDPESLLLSRTDVESIRATIANLPEPFRETLVLRELEELSYKEIAMLTDVPIGTVMSRLARARRILAKMLCPTAEPHQEARL